ncbi:hypothetical protein [Pseudonocardia sp. TRM90224]|nr:hypothetical protein [Pseudonocardia sp. TRM90224]
MGLHPFTHESAFSLFHHEIFAVTTDDPLDAVVLQDVLWPGFFFG